MYKEEEPVHTSAATQASEDIKSSSSTLPASTPVVETPTAEEVGPSAFATPMETPGDLSQVGEKDGGLAASGDDSQEQKMAPSSTTTPEQKEGQSAEGKTSPWL